MKKRLHAFYERMYERFQMFLMRHPPKRKVRKNEHVPSREMRWYSGDEYVCEECPWVLMRWDVSLLGWQCTYCGQHYHPFLPVTEKRPVVTVTAILPPRQTTPIPRSISMPLPPLSEQRAVQPPQVSQGISYEQIEVFQPRQAQVFKKYHSGQLKLDANGKPIFTKTGVPVRTDQFKLLRIPTRDDHRRTG